MRGQVKSGSYSADQTRVKMAAPALDKPKHAPTCAYAKEVLSCNEDLAASYRDWLKAYVSDPKRLFGIYRPAELGKWEIALRNPSAKTGNLVRRWFARYTFFPHTKIPSCRFPSGYEAILNDWTVVGTDLFATMQQYKINASDVPDPGSARHPAATSR